MTTGAVLPVTVTLKRSGPISATTRAAIISVKLAVDAEEMRLLTSLAEATPSSSERRLMT